MKLLYLFIRKAYMNIKTLALWSTFDSDLPPSYEYVNGSVTQFPAQYTYWRLAQEDKPLC
jgi:hypothetical protein